MFIQKMGNRDRCRQQKLCWVHYFVIYRLISIWYVEAERIYEDGIISP